MAGRCAASGPTPRATDVPAATRRHLAAVALAAVLVGRRRGDRADDAGPAHRPATRRRTRSRPTRSTPPTALAATGNDRGVAHLDRQQSTPTPTGYEVLRSTTSGSGYTIVKHGHAGVGDRHDRLARRRHVLLRPAVGYFQNWLSVNSNQASVTLGGQTSSGYQGVHGRLERRRHGRRRRRLRIDRRPTPAPTAAASATDASTGTNNNHRAAPTRARTATGSGTSGSASRRRVTSVDGIQVRADVGHEQQRRARAGSASSCRGTAGRPGRRPSRRHAASRRTTYTLGAANDTWGRTWTGAKLSNANFRVRVIDASSQPNKTYLLEYLAVQVTYTP